MCLCLNKHYLLSFCRLCNELTTPTYAVEFFDNVHACELRQCMIHSDVYAEMSKHWAALQLFTNTFM